MSDAIDLERMRRFGAWEERQKIIKLIDRQICFDAQADPDGRCSHHGGKCYELKQLINSLESE